MYVIVNRKDANLFWNNTIGWADLDSADRFTIKEQKTLHLPMDGYWVPLWSVDMIQFARLLAECNSAGVFTPENLAPVADSMGLNDDQVLSLIERAEIRWEEEKEKVFRKA